MMEEKQESSDVFKGYTYKVVTGYGNLYVTINEQGGRPCQVLIVLGKAGSFATAMIEAVANLISLSLQQGVAMEKIICQLFQIRDSSSVVVEGGEVVFSIPDAVARVMRRYQREREGSRV